MQETSISGWGKSPGVGNSNPLQCCCLENPMDRGAWQATVHRAAKTQVRLKRPDTHTWTQNGSFQIFFIYLITFSLVCSLLFLKLLLTAVHGFFNFVEFHASFFFLPISMYLSTYVSIHSSTHPCACISMSF